MTVIEKINGLVGRSLVGKWFKLQGSGARGEIKNSYFLTEIRAGLTTFFTMAYIISVNANIMTQSGATCVCDGGADDPICLDNEAYSTCLLGIQRDYITATAVISCLASVMFGLFTNLPVALAPGMGINAYFAFQVVGFHGSGPVPFRLALAAVFMEGFIFIFLSLIGMRQWLVKMIPNSLKVASSVGIGFFLTLIGLTYSAGIGAITGAVATPVELGGCIDEYKDEFGQCTSHKLQNPKLWIGIMLGGIVTGILMLYRVKAAIIIGIAIVSIMSWPRPTNFTYFPYTPEGSDRFDFFKKVVTFRPIENILDVIDWDLKKAGGQFGIALFTFLYVDILDCTGTLYSMARFSGVVDEETGDFPRSTVAYCTDAISISIGAVLGTSPVTAFVESAAGIAEGGKTGLTAVTTGICFFISIFFAPIFASIPPWATGCTLVIVGALMVRQCTDINWRYLGDALPAFATIMFMPFSYSIAYGLIAGIMVYFAINVSIWLIKLASGGRILPPDYDAKEVWTLKHKHGYSPWFVRLAKGDKHFWRHPVPTDAREAASDSSDAASGTASATGSQPNKEYADTKVSPAQV